MNLYIESKDMPTSCEKCNLIKNTYDWFYCGIGEKDGKLLNLENKYDELIYTSSRHPDCPLKEIPSPHGDLIDADEIVSKLINNHYTISINGYDVSIKCILEDTLKVIREAPAIIKRC